MISHSIGPLKTSDRLKKLTSYSTQHGKHSLVYDFQEMYQHFIDAKLAN